ncbi:MAG: DUF402 domain-containing protein [Deltaproteobacteria bacterium]
MNPKIYRKRFIPDEIVDISGDEILYYDGEILVTRWVPIHKRNDFSGGISFAFISEGYKIGCFYGLNKELLFWYVDIIETEYDKENNSLTFVDLLADVKIFPDGRVEILDIDELNQAFEKGLIDKRQFQLSLANLKKVTDMLEQTSFPPRFVSEFLEKL